MGPTPTPEIRSFEVIPAAAGVAANSTTASPKESPRQAFRVTIEQTPSETRGRTLALQARTILCFSTLAALGVVRASSGASGYGVCTNAARPAGSSAKLAAAYEAI